MQPGAPITRMNASHGGRSRQEEGPVWQAMRQTDHCEGGGREGREEHSGPPNRAALPWEGCVSLIVALGKLGVIRGRSESQPDRHGGQLRPLTHGDGVEAQGERRGVSQLHREVDVGHRSAEDDGGQDLRHPEGETRMGLGWGVTSGNSVKSLQPGKWEELLCPKGDPGLLKQQKRVSGGPKG